MHKKGPEQLSANHSTLINFNQLISNKDVKITTNQFTSKIFVYQNYFYRQKVVEYTFEASSSRDE